MEHEEWRPVPGCPKYEVSNCGNVRNAKTQKLLSIFYDRAFYPTVSIYDGTQINKRTGKFVGRHINVHRLVALAFVDGRDEVHNEVDHIDRNKDNNHADNLRWVTHQENLKNRDTFLKHNWKTTKIRFDSVDGESTIFDNIYDAAEAIGYAARSIAQNCTGVKRDFKKGKFSFVEEVDNEKNF